MVDPPSSHCEGAVSNNWMPKRLRLAPCGDITGRSSSYAFYAFGTQNKYLPVCVQRRVLPYSTGARVELYASSSSHGIGIRVYSFLPVAVSRCVLASLTR